MKIGKIVIAALLSVSMVFTMMPSGTLRAMATEEPQQTVTEEPAGEQAEPQSDPAEEQGQEDAETPGETPTDDVVKTDDSETEGAGAGEMSDADAEEPAAGGAEAGETEEAEDADAEPEYRDVAVALKADSDENTLPADQAHVIRVTAANANEEGDALVRLYFWNYDRDFYDKDKKDDVKEICDKVTVKDLKDDNTITFDNNTKDASKVEAELITEKAAPDTDAMVRYLEFEIPADTEYEFDLPLVLEEDAEPLHVIIEPTVEGQDEDSDALGEPVDVQWEKEKETSATKDGSSADYVIKQGNEGADISGPAAEDKAAAEDVLSNQTTLTDKKAVQVAKTLFAAGENRGGEGEEGEEGEDEEVPPSSGDGSNIDVMTAKWLTPDTVNNDDANLLYVRPNSSSELVRLQINYALSGEHRYDPGDIVISFPASIFKKRNSNQSIGEIMVPYPEAPSKKSDFNWTQVGDKIVLTNTKMMSAATKGYFQIAFDGINPALLQDMGLSDDFVATIEVTTHKGNILSLSTDALTAQFDTEATLTDVQKRNISVTRVKASQLPANQRIEGEDEYIKVDWYVWGTTNANTYYTIDQFDFIPQAEAVEKKKVVADGEVKDPNKEISYSDALRYDEGAQIGQDVTLKTEADVKGFVLGGASADTSELAKNKVYTGARDGRGSDYSFSTVYPAKQFEKDTNYTFHNKIRYTVTEVDPAVSEHTNPHVNDGAEDPQKKTVKEASSSVTWYFTDPKWINPGGHYMVNKNGNDDTARNNRTHKSSNTYSDLHINSDGYYGIYPSAINELQDQYAAHGEDGSVRLSYTINTRGWTLPWMYDGGYAEFKEGELPARMIGNYNRPITMTTTDTGVSIGRNGAKLRVGEDYTYAEIEFPNEPYVWTGKPQNINSDGTWTALTAGDGTFKYTRDYNKAHWPDVTLQLQLNGEWVDFARVSWKSGQRVIFLESGAVLTNSGVVKVPENTQNFRTIVTTQNTVGGPEATEALQAGFEYDIRPVINLKSTSKLVNQFDALFAQTHLPSMAIYNNTNMLIERADVSPSDAERVVHSIDRAGYDSIRGYTTDTSVYPYKRATQKLREVDYENRLIPIHYEAYIEERSVINDQKTWQEAVDEKRLQSETSCIWRDLLPKGVTPVISSIKLRDGDTLVRADTYENYKDSGRTLLVVEAKLKPVPQTYRSGDMTYYMDVPRIEFTANYDFESWKDYGSNIHNVISFESGNDTLGTIPGYTGERDDPRGRNNVSTQYACINDEEKTLMTDLNKNGNDPPDKPAFVYAGASTTIDILAAARTSLYKDVEVNNDGIWSEGTYYQDIYGPPVEATEGGQMRTVYEGGQYTYRLRVMSDPETVSEGLVIYDALEDFRAKGEDNDSIDTVAVEEDALWKGRLRSVDTSQLEDMGCLPVVYYSTKVRNYHDGESSEYTLTEDETDTPKDSVVNLNNSDVWVKASEYTGSMSDVTAVAIDCRYADKNKAKAKNINEVENEDGTKTYYFRLQPMESAVVLLNMKAPSGETARELLSQKGEWGDSAMTYNNAYLYAASFDKTESQAGAYYEDGSDDRDFIRKDYTKVGLKEYSLNADKKWDDDNDRDRVRPKKIVFHLYANDKDTGKSETLNVGEGETSVTFEHIPYTDDDGEKIRYTIVEEEIEGYTGEYELKDRTFHFTNTHEPAKTSVSGEKTWVDDTEDVRPASIDIELYADGEYLKKQTVKPAPNGTWSYSFTNLFKYKDGEEINYTVKEVKTAGTSDALDSYAPEYTPTEEGFDIENPYHPFGDLEVSKKIENTTEVSKNKEFTFTFVFNEKREGENGEEEAPIFDEFEYEILDENGEAVTGDDGEPLTGTVKTNESISIKGGQKIHVKEIPQGLLYRVSEEDAEGFTLSEKTGDSGTIKPNDTAEAAFTNFYYASGRINLEAKKVLENRTINKNQFTFVLYEVTTGEDGEEVLTEKTNATNGASEDAGTNDEGVFESTASVAFGSIRYTQDDHGKTFIYRMVETDREKPGYTYSKKIYDVNVTVEDNGDGTLKITKEYKDADGNTIDEPVFKNSYEAEGNVKLNAWKSLPGRDLKDDEFTFELLDENGDPIMTHNGSAVDTGDGETPAAGDSETPAAGDSETPAAGDGETPAAGDSETPAAGDGETPAAGDETAGTPVTVTNKKNGTVTFDPSKIEALNYTAKDIGKTYYYAIREVAGNDETVTYDKHVYGYAVTIKDNGDGTLTSETLPATPIFGDETQPEKITAWTLNNAVLPIFENRLEPGGFSITKTTEDSPYSDHANPSQTFKFKVLLIGDDVTDETVTDYKISAAGNNTGEGTGDGQGSGSEGNGSGAEGSGQGTNNESGGTQNVGGTNGSGTYDGVDWELTSDGTLTIGKDGEEQTLESRNRTSSSWPWNSYRGQIKNVQIKGTVIGQGYLNSMFASMSNLETISGIDNLNMSAVTSTAYMFSLCTGIESLDLSSWDTGNVTNMNYMFNGMSSLSSLKILFDTGSVTSMNSMFGNTDGSNQTDSQYLDNLKTLDLSSFEIGSSTSMSRFLAGLNNLEELKLGTGMRFNSNPMIGTPTGAGYTGRWIRTNGTGSAYASSDFNGKSGSEVAGTWGWEEGYTVYYLPGEASGEMDPQTMLPGEEVQLSPNQFTKTGYEFKHWVVTDSSGNPKDPETTYNDGAKVTGTSGGKLYLKAVFQPVDTTVEMVDGSFEITLRAGETATFEDIPAGTAYQIYEETPAGWLLVRSDNVAGSIEPNTISGAAFVNKYDPTKVSVQLHATKTLDYQAAKANQYEFVLKFNGTEIDRKKTIDGGFITFDPLEFDAYVLGESETSKDFHYTIEEVDPGDNEVDWDTHTEDVTVTVSKDDNDDLSAVVTYDSDGARFSNKTRPGNLRVSKAAEGADDANSDKEFTFKITLNNADGMPLSNGEEIYWYTEKTDSSDEDSDGGKSTSKGYSRTDNSIAMLHLLLRAEKTNHASDIMNSNTAGVGASKNVLFAAKAPVLRAGGDNQDPTDYSYTGSVQTFVAPASGYYKLEAWGAQGGNVVQPKERNNGSYDGTAANGGKGGYTAGTVFLEEGQRLYIYVGGQGTHTPMDVPVPSDNPRQRVEGGWNGGGYAANGQTTWEAKRNYGSGGGATDFRLNGGAWNDFDSLKSRIMVAGGGGGAKCGTGGAEGGAAGGLTGSNGKYNSSYNLEYGTYGYGGTQTAPGYAHPRRSDSAAIDYSRKVHVGGFGYADQTTNDFSHAGGGSGYYGGGGSNHVQGGGGGSSFISGYTGCNAIAANSTAGNIQHTGQPNHYSGMVFSDMTMTGGNRSGNGAAKITPQSREVTFYPNGATGTAQTRTYWPGAISLPHAEDDFEMAKANSVFLGWAKDPDALGPDFEAYEDVADTLGKTDKLYAVWMGENEYLLHLDANGGFSEVQWKRADASDTSPIALPEPTNPGQVFAGWNTKQDGSGTNYFDSVTGEQLGAQAKQTITLYAQWADANTKARYKVEHYKLDPDGQDYSLYETENLIGERGSNVLPEEKDYRGFVCVSKDPEPDENGYTIPTSGNNLVVKYYYNPCEYTVRYDGNGATSGQMNGVQEMLGGVQYNLWENNYHKKGYLFVGWSTKQTAGPGDVVYIDKQRVKNLTKEDGAEVVLYAQWLGNETHLLEPTNGVIIVKCKAGESVVIPDLPAGTTYTIEEIDNPAGWTQKGEIEGNGETIRANVTNEATVTNKYHASGEAKINAHKILEGANIEEGQFEFELYRDADLTDRIDSATNGTIDTYEQIENDTGTLIDNTYYQTSLVEFTPIQYTQDDIGETFKYYVREKGCVNEDSANGISIDKTIFEVSVTVEDAGGGLLNTTVTYAKVTSDGVEQLGNEPIFENRMKPASLSISKEITGATDGVSDTEFKFTVDLLDADEQPIEGSYDVEKDGEVTGSIESGGVVKLIGGETATIVGLPHGTTYKVTEQDQDNWKQTNAENVDGILAPGETAEASFANQYTPPDKYLAKGSVQLTAKKEVVGGIILEDDEFTFELTGDKNYSQTKTCDVVSTDADPVSASTVTFDKINYTLEDLEYTQADQEAIDQYVTEQMQWYQEQYDTAKDEYDTAHADDDPPAKEFMDFNAYIKQETGLTINKLREKLTKDAEDQHYKENDFIYYVREVPGDDQDVTYDTARYYYKVHAVDNGDGTIETSVTKWKMGTKVDPDTNESVPDDTEVDDIIFKNSKMTQIKVYKRWVDNDDIDGFRPDKETFAEKLHLMNGDQEVTVQSDQIKITEDEDGNLTITYMQLPAYDEDGEITYTVKEDDIEGYTPKDGKTEAANGETLMNVHAPGTTDLKIRKSLDGYYDGGANSNVTLAFKVEARDSKDKVIFTGYAGLTFEEGGPLTQTATVKNVPVRATTITVSEEYTGAYKKQEPAKAVYNESDEVWEVEMDNTHKGTPHEGSGIVNRYEDGKYVRSEDGTPPQDDQN